MQSDGQGLHTVGGAAGRSIATEPPPSFAWIPGKDALAVAAAGTGLWIVPASGSPRLLALGKTHVQALAASPDGGEVAAVVTLPYVNVLNRRDEILLVSVTSGTTRRVYLAPVADGVDLAGFWPDGRGLLFWSDPLHSASLAADGLGLFSLPFAGAKARLLATTLTYVPWLSWAPSGNQVAIVAGWERIAWAGKRLLICDARAAVCKPIATPQGIAPMDPVWPSRGIAMVGARAMPQTWGFTSTASLSAWVATRALWVLPSVGQGARRMVTGGVYTPTRAGHGRMLYVLGGRIWITSISGGPPTAVTGPVAELQGGFGFYGETWPAYAFWSAHAS